MSSISREHQDCLLVSHTWSSKVFETADITTDYPGWLFLTKKPHCKKFEICNLPSFFFEINSWICRNMSKYPHCSSETVNAIFLPEGKLWPHLDIQRCVEIWLSDHIICFTGQARGPHHPSFRPPMFTGSQQKQRQTQIRNGSLKTTLIYMCLKVALHHLSGPRVQLSPD